MKTKLDIYSSLSNIYHFAESLEYLGGDAKEVATRIKNLKESNILPEWWEEKSTEEMEDSISSMIEILNKIPKQKVAHLMHLTQLLMNDCELSHRI